LMRCRSSFQSLSLSEPCMTVPNEVRVARVQDDFRVRGCVAV
jgi:hypothetical protein